MNNQHTSFGKTGHILASVGAAVGIANLVLFPARVYHYGGFAFIIAFLGCTIILGVPLMIAEIALGRSQQTNAVHAYKTIGGRYWKAAGFLGLIANLFVLSFYIIVSGWALYYLFLYFAQYEHITTAVASAKKESLPSTAAVGSVFGSFVHQPKQVLLFSGIYMVLSSMIVALNIRVGIERVSRFFVPFLVLLMIVLIIILPMVSTTPLHYENFAFDVSALFKIDASGRIGIIEAAGQAFFSLALGACAMITYGAHLQKHVTIPSTAHFIVHIDSLVALLGAFLILPLISSSERLGADPTLVFITLVDTFQAFPQPWDRVIGIVFFLLFNFAIITSTIAMMEPSITYLAKNKSHLRKRYALLIGAITFLMSIPAVYSFSNTAPKWLTNFLHYGNPNDGLMGYFNFLIDFFGTFCLIVGTLLLTIFIRSKWKMAGLFKELSTTSYQPTPLLKQFLKMSIYWLAPIFMILLLIGECLKLKFKFGL